MGQIAPIATSNGGTADASAFPCSMEAERALRGSIFADNRANTAFDPGIPLRRRTAGTGWQ